MWNSRRLLILARRLQAVRFHWSSLHVGWVTLSFAVFCLFLTFVSGVLVKKKVFCSQFFCNQTIRNPQINPSIICAMFQASLWNTLLIGGYISYNFLGCVIRRMRNSTSRYLRSYVYANEERAGSWRPVESTSSHGIKRHARALDWQEAVSAFEDFLYRRVDLCSFALCLSNDLDLKCFNLIFMYGERSWWTDKKTCLW